MTRDPILYLLFEASYYLRGVDMMLRHWVPKNTPVNPGVYADRQKPLTLIQTVRVIDTNKQHAKELTEVAELLQNAGF